jgi:hypothetical protein
VPGWLAASAAALGQITTAVEDFLDRISWRYHHVLPWRGTLKTNSFGMNR